MGWHAGRTSATARRKRTGRRRCAVRSTFWPATSTAPTGKRPPELVADPRGLLLASIDLALGRRSLAKLAAPFVSRALKRAELARLGDLLEAQRLRHRMFSSCGWFWDELDRIEPKNCLKAAAAAVFRTARATGSDPAPWLEGELSKIRSARTGLTADQVVREERAKLAG